MNSCIYSGLRWLVRSGIQDERGGVADAYRGEYHDFQPILTESTAYFLCAALTSEPEQGGVLPETIAAGRFLLQRAQDPASDLLIDTLPWPKGATKRPDSANGRPAGHVACFYSSGLAMRALLKLWQATKDVQYLQAAERCGVSLLTRLTRVDGSFFPVYDLTSAEAQSGGTGWRRQAEVHQLKVGLGFWELEEATGNRDFSEAARKMLPWALRRHESFLPGADTREEILDRAHAYCCFLEGLLPTAGLDRSANQALQFGILKVENLMSEYRPRYERCDVLAQVLRLRLYADRLGIMELDYARAEAEARRLEDFQMQSLDPKLDGGFATARRGRIRTPHMSPRVNALAAQALAMWEQAEEGGFREPWQSLI